MKRLGKFAAVAMMALALMTSPAAEADPGVNSHMTVDVTIGDCTYSDLSTSANPPGTLTVYRSSVVLPPPPCECTLNNDFQVSFDDAAGTATIDRINFTCTRNGISCTWEATNAVLVRQGTTRTYSGTVTFLRASGNSFFCPSSFAAIVTLAFD
jgi:hypothetical protein